MSPMVVIQGWEYGNAPINFNKMASMCPQFGKLSDTEARQLVARLPELCVEAEQKGYIKEGGFVGIAGDGRSDSSALHKNRACWFNAEPFIQKREADEEAKNKAAADLTRKKMLLLKNKERKNADSEYHAWRKEELTSRVEGDLYCLCASAFSKLGEEDEEWWGCEGKRKCPWRGWIHTECEFPTPVLRIEPKQIEPNGKVVTEASKVKKRKRNDEAESGSDEVHVQFWCEYCYLYNRNANLEEDRFI